MRKGSQNFSLTNQFQLALGRRQPPKGLSDNFYN